MEPSNSKNCCCIPQRYVLSIMGFLAMVNAYTMRGCLSLAITEMVTDPTNKTIQSDKFDWDQEDQGLILGAFFYGYVITHVPGALLCKRYGGKLVLCCGLLLNALLTVLTPLTIQIADKYGMVVLRVIMGLGQGTVFPALCALLASWAPEKERGRLGSLVFGGGQIGAIFGNFFTGQLLYHTSWHWVFYFFGGVALVWFIVFASICYNSPAEHPFIGEAEREYLHTEMQHLKRNDSLPPTPWKAIFTSVPMWAMISAQVGHDWGFYVMAIDLPKYLADVIHVPVRNNGLYSSVPFFVMWVFTVISGALCDLFIKRNYLSVTNARKWLTGVAAIVPGVFLLLASYAGNNEILVVILFTIGMGMMGVWYPGMKVNPLDLSPNYAPTLMAISNGIGALTGAFVPSVVGFLTPNRDLIEWRTVFWMTFIIFAVTTVSYSIWASGEVQPWNDPLGDDDDEDQKRRNNRTIDPLELENDGEKFMLKEHTKL